MVICKNTNQSNTTSRDIIMSYFIYLFLAKICICFQSFENCNISLHLFLSQSNMYSVQIRLRDIVGIVKNNNLTCIVDCTIVSTDTIYIILY